MSVRFFTPLRLGVAAALAAAFPARALAPFVVPPGRIAQGCVALLAKDHVRVSEVVCPHPMVARAGASMRCVARQGALRAGMTVTMRTWNPATKDALMKCTVDKHPLTPR